MSGKGTLLFQHVHAGFWIFLSSHSCEDYKGPEGGDVTLGLQEGLFFP